MVTGEALLRWSAEPIPLAKKRKTLCSGSANSWMITWVGTIIAVSFIEDMTARRWAWIPDWHKTLIRQERMPDTTDVQKRL